MMISRELCQQAVDKWGVEKQLDMVVEECAELIKAVIKYKRTPNHNTELNIIEETIDVGFMLEQLKVIFPHPYAWNNFENTKIAYLERKINENL